MENKKSNVRKWLLWLIIAMVIILVIALLVYYLQKTKDIKDDLSENVVDSYVEDNSEIVENEIIEEETNKIEDNDNNTTSNKTTSINISLCPTNCTHIGILSLSYTIQ